MGSILSESSGVKNRTGGTSRVSARLEYSSAKFPPLERSLISRRGVSIRFFSIMCLAICLKYTTSSEHMSTMLGSSMYLRPEEIIPAHVPTVAEAMSSRSRSNVLSPLIAQSRATAVPVLPPPITTTSYFAIGSTYS